MMSPKNIPYGIIVPLLILPYMFSTIFMSSVGRSTLVSIIYFCIYAYCLQYKRMRRISLSFPMMIWLTLTVFHLINAYLKHVPDLRVPDYIQGFRIYVSICIFTFLYSTNGKKTAQYFFWSLGVWLFMAFLTTGYTSGRRLSGKDVIAVEFGKNAALMIISGLYLSVIERSKISQVISRIVWPFIIILLAQARNGFGMALIQCVGYYYSIVMRTKISVKRFIMIVFAIIVLFVLINIVINNTELGTRFQTDVEYAEEGGWGQDYSTGTVFDYILGERVIYYVNGWNLFIKYPLTGIGLGGYEHYTKMGFPMHVEYMLHLSEGGIIAFVLWMMFIIYLFVIILQSSLTRRMKSFALFTMFAILFTCMFSVMYHNENSVSLYGLILSICYPSSQSVFQSFYGRNRFRNNKIITQNNVRIKTTKRGRF